MYLKKLKAQFKNPSRGDFPDVPMAKTLHSQWETQVWLVREQISMLQIECVHATTKDPASYN